jgi:hypothetical protein
MLCNCSAIYNFKVEVSKIDRDHPYIQPFSPDLLFWDSEDVILAYSK